MNYQEIISDMCSGDVQKIRISSCAIIDQGQNRDELKPLIPFIQKMRAATQGLEMGGMFAPNKRFPEYAIKTLEFHRDSSGCTCGLYTIGYDSFDPDNEKKAGNIDIVSTSADYYDIVVRCKKCSKIYDVAVENGHWVFYRWRERV